MSSASRQNLGLPSTSTSSATTQYPRRDASPKTIKAEFDNWCKIVDDGTADFSNCFTVDSGALDMPALPILRGDDAKYNLSDLAKLLPDRRNILHYVVSQWISDNIDEGDSSDEGRQSGSRERRGEGDAVVELDPEPNAESRDPEGRPLSHFEKRACFITWLLLRHPGMLSSKSEKQDKTPLCLLIERSEGIEFCPSKKNNDILAKAAKRVLGNAKVRSEFGKVLEGQGQGTLIHSAIKHFGSRVLPFVSLVTESAMSVQDSDGKTPLHIAVDVNQWRYDDIQQRVQLIRELVKRCDQGALTKKHGLPKWTEKSRKSPYIYMKSQANDLWPSDQASSNQQKPEEKKCFDLAVYHLEDAYMSLKDEDVFEHLYEGRRDIHSATLINLRFYFDRYLRLDLSEINTRNLSKLDDTGIEKYLGTMEVATILKEVRLPKQLLIDQLPRGADDSVPIKITKDVFESYQNYTCVFNWLRKKGVKKIHELTVEDNEFLPHSDNAIVEALRDIEVNIWNWIQDDLCSDTIVSAAPEALHIFLYSTGQKAVLQNWCNGLNELKQLKRIDLSVCLGKKLKSGHPNDCNYEEVLKKAFPNVDIRVKVGSLKDKWSAESVLKKGGEEVLPTRQPENLRTPWEKQMKLSAIFVHNIPAEIDDGVEVKIAIIDDGVNIEQIPDAHIRIASGMSFHSEYIRGGHHFPSSFGHGTRMADCVLQIFPKAKLYIARIEVLRGEGQTQPTLSSSSAARGIEWAVEQDVDIILMSWTIEETPGNKEAIRKMKAALGRASDKNILLFCAAKDIGEMWENNPGYPQNSNFPMFCVGGATSDSEGSNIVGDQPVDILCPRRFPDSKSRGSPDTPGPAGSSIAAALAVGVAGLLLYYNGIHRKRENEKPGAPRAGDESSLKFGGLREYRAMKHVLGRIGGSKGFLLPTVFVGLEGDLPEGYSEERLDEIIRKIRGILSEILGRS